MRCEVRYSKELGRGICYAPHKEGGGHYVRLPVWESLVLPLAVLALLGCWALDLVLGKE